ncbi:MAG: transposase [Thiolinea sp.]
MFFRAESYSTDRLRHAWHRFVLSQSLTFQVADRLVLLGDHTSVVKDGGRMPGVVSMRETSETQSKPAYFRGQCWGAVGVLVGQLSQCFCLPLNLQMHQGFQHLRITADDTDKQNMGELILHMALEFAYTHNRPSWLVLDAFFSNRSVFRLAFSVLSIETRQPFVQVVTRAKKNYVAYWPAEAKPTGKPGAPKRYGDKLALREVFDHQHLFRASEVEVYGKTETVLLMSHCLLWRPLGWKYPLQFVWAITSHGPIVLMCSDLNVSAETVLRLYCARTRIETLFATLKQRLGVFQFHFWSAYLPKHSRRPFSNRLLKMPQAEGLEHVKACWQAMERFVLCGCIATGLLQWFSLKYHSALWDKKVLYLRTRSRELPSENTVRQILAPWLTRQFNPSRKNTRWWKIYEVVNGNYDEEELFEQQAA